MGCIAGLRKAAKSLRKEITPIVMQTAGALVKGFAGRIEDGKLTKAEAHETGRECLAAAFQIRKTAAGVAMDLAYEATMKLGERIEDLGTDDSGQEPDPLE